jgi:sarcosine oxidase, subunit beta
MKTADAVIVGGGCMGASVAYYLTQAGYKNVLLIERDETLGTGATGRNAGGVRHQFSHEANVKLSQESIALIANFEAELGYAVDFFQDGYLFLLSSEENEGRFRKNVEMQRRLGVEVDWLTPEEAVRLAPGINPEGIRAATFCGKDGIADPGGVTLGFAGAAQRAGAEVWLNTEVTGIRTEGGKVVGVETSKGPVSTSIVVNAAGPWAKQIGAMAGLTLPIEPLRRHIFVSEPPAGAEGWARDGHRLAPESRIMVIDFETTFYFHREGANLLFGMGDPTEPYGFDQEVNWEVLERVAPVAAHRLPVIEDAPIAHAWAGLYEMTPDAMPILGPMEELQGFHMIGGFSGHGFQHAPAAGRILADLIVGRDPGMDLSPFAASRFVGTTVGGEINVV